MKKRNPRTKLIALVIAMIAVIIMIASAAGEGQPADEFELESTIAFSSNRDRLDLNPLLAAEIYLMNEDGTNLRRLTENTDLDIFAELSPDGKKIVFDSNRNRAAGEPINTSDLFVMSTDGTEQTFLIRGSSPDWSPDNKDIAFHASASGTGLPIKDDLGAATSDSDIFVMNVDDRLAGAAGPKNITNNPLTIDDDPDWSPDGQKIVFTSHLTSDDPINSVTAEIYVINADGSGGPVQLTFNTVEERAPSWSPDGTRILFMCRIGPPGPTGIPTFEICSMNADGTGQVQLTNNSVFDGLGSGSFSPDGQKIVFIRAVPTQQLWLMNADGTGQIQLTNPPSINTLPNWGLLRVR